MAIGGPHVSDVPTMQWLCDGLPGQFRLQYAANRWSPGRNGCLWRRHRIPRAWHATFSCTRPYCMYLPICYFGRHRCKAWTWADWDSPHESFQDWFHVERPLDPQAHAAYEDRAGTEFFDRLQKPEHAPLCQTPAFLHEDANDKCTPTLASAYQSAHEMQTIEEEGRRFSKHYLLDAQFFFSRVQHHVHRQTKDGEFMPLNACAKKADGLTVASRNVSHIRIQKEIIKINVFKKLTQSKELLLNHF